MLLRSNLQPSPSSSRVAMLRRGAPEWLRNQYLVKDHEEKRQVEKVKGVLDILGDSHRFQT